MTDFALHLGLLLIGACADLESGLRALVAARGM